LAIAAVKQTQDILVIAGSGIELKKLLQLAGSLAYQRNSEESISDAITSAINNNNKIIFLSTVTESEKNILLKNCTALLMPGEEDFGLVGLEAAQYGKPVITYHKSGIAEVLKDGKQAIHTQEKSVEAVVSAIRRISEVKLTSKKISESIQEYEIAWFRELFHKTIYHFWQQHSTIAPVKKKLEYHTK
jgi:glycosyltransferase involved in cell wall biosynthesis